MTILGSDSYSAPNTEKHGEATEDDSVTITNDEETVTPTPSTPPNTPPGVRTGDDTPVGSYLTLVLMALAVAVIAGMVLRRRKQIR